MIIGFTGKYAAGKTVACKYLEDNGFTFFSLSDVIREEVEKAGQEQKRENHIAMGNALREKHGPGILGSKTKEKIKEGDYAIDSIRSPYEVEELRKAEGFILVGIEAPIEIRFERLKERGRPGDPETLEELKASEEKENVKSKTNQQLDATFEMADVIINNEGSLGELHEMLDKLKNGK